MIAWLVAVVIATPTPCGPVEVPCYLRAGDRATFGGELWPSAFALAVLEDRARGMVAEAQLGQAMADLDAERQLRQVDRTEAAAILAAEQAAHRRTQDLARELVEPPAWYESPWLAAAIGAAAGVALAVVVR